MLTIFEGKFTRLKDDRDNLIKAKEALELADPGELCVVSPCMCPTTFTYSPVESVKVVIVKVHNYHANRKLVVIPTRV